MNNKKEYKIGSETNLDYMFKNCRRDNERKIFARLNGWPEPVCEHYSKYFQSEISCPECGTRLI